MNRAVGCLFTMAVGMMVIALCVLVVVATVRAVR